MASVNLFTLDIEGQCVERDPRGKRRGGQCEKEKREKTEVPFP